MLEPCYGPYRNLTKLTGAVPVGVAMPKEQGRFVVDPERLAAVTAKTKAVIVNTPGNPTGRVLTLPELKGIAAIAERHDLWILSDSLRACLWRQPPRLDWRAQRRDRGSNCHLEQRIENICDDRMAPWLLSWPPIARAGFLSRINHLTTRCATSYVQYAAITAYTKGMPHLENDAGGLCRTPGSHRRGS